jgi:hypothetical protein
MARRQALTLSGCTVKARAAAVLVRELTPCAASSLPSQRSRRSAQARCPRGLRGSRSAASELLRFGPRFCHADDVRRAYREAARGLPAADAIHEAPRPLPGRVDDHAQAARFGIQHGVRLGPGSSALTSRSVSRRRSGARGAVPSSRSRAIAGFPSVNFCSSVKHRSNTGSGVGFGSYLRP